MGFQICSGALVALILTVYAVRAERWLQERLPQTSSGTEDHLVSQAFRDEAIVWDIPLRFHAPKLMIW